MPASELLTLAAYGALCCVPRRSVSGAVGRLSRAPLPGPMIGLAERVFSGLLGADLREAAPARYGTVDELFTRRLRPGARPIADAPVVSPVDGEIRAAGALERGIRMAVKGNEYSVADLTGDPLDDRLHRGGSFAVLYLAPSQYHRVHAPVSGQLTALRMLPGDAFPMNAIGERHVRGLLIRNRRLVLRFDGGQGPFTLVMVAAFAVGELTVDWLGERQLPPGYLKIQPPRKVEKGEALAAFHLGSTTVLLTPPNVTLSRRSGPVRVGQPLLDPQ